MIERRCSWFAAIATGTLTRSPALANLIVPADLNPYVETIRRTHAVIATDQLWKTTERKDEMLLNEISNGANELLGYDAGILTFSIHMSNCYMEIAMTDAERAKYRAFCNELAGGISLRSSYQQTRCSYVH